VVENGAPSPDGQRRQPTNEEYGRMYAEDDAYEKKIRELTEMSVSFLNELDQRYEAEGNLTGLIATKYCEEVADWLGQNPECCEPFLEVYFERNRHKYDESTLASQLVNEHGVLLAAVARKAKPVTN
jgi:hypothetical protein